MSAVTSSELPSVFMTFGWCRTAYAALRSLTTKGVQVHMGCSSKLAMCRFSRWRASFSILPSFYQDGEEYVNRVLQLCQELGATVIFPGHEDVLLFARYRYLLPHQIKMAIPSASALDLAMDKLRAIEFAGKVGCPVPRTIAGGSVDEIVSAAEDLGFPVVVKTRFGNSAKGVKIAHNADEAHTAVNEFISTYALQKHRFPFVQEFLGGEVVGVCCLFNRGKLVAQFGERYFRSKDGTSFGTTTFRQSWCNDKVIEYGGRVLRALEWHGVAQMDFMKGEDGTYRLVEINPRFWGALQLSIAAGVDFPWLLYNVAVGGALPDMPPAWLSCTCRWVLGDLMALLHLLRRGRLAAAAAVLRPHPRIAHDDLFLDDPLVFISELADYGAKFLKYKSTNPVEKGMIS